MILSYEVKAGKLFRFVESSAYYYYIIINRYPEKTKIKLLVYFHKKQIEKIKIL